MKFKEFFKNGGNKKAPKKTPEQLFEEVTGVTIPSMKSFVAWLALNGHVKPYVLSKGKPVPLSKLPESKKILYLVQKLPKIKILANEFASKFGKTEYLHE